MSSKLMKQVIVFGILAVVLISAQNKKVVLDDDFEDDIVKDVPQHKVQFNKATAGNQVKSSATYKLLARFDDENDWSERGTVTVSKDSNGKILSVDVQNNDVSYKSNTLKSQFDEKCKAGKLYQVRVSEFDLQTSIPACLYAKNGFNDTLVFHQDFSGQLSSIGFDVIDYTYLASLEKNPKKRRLMTTKQYEVFETKAHIQPLVEGTRPIFTKFKYDSTGRESKEKNPELPQEEQNQSFFSKYWLYILIAFLVLPNLLGGGGAEGGQAAAK